ncbi:putative siderophore biosynthesis protein SbnA [Dictyobacter alpinus]|uniref:N-(2-amino-2-carboxyethyl)-L-glutamate synthase n=1 Tax=Dictyobacter alpinus TaxID=2014873 RepID=A0A402BB49_9CHLR|nr:2,3-diaminopropionate biosynthesis protein SbnA [Dictyobacter alpinus]GCE28510.1 putative siderophore biosynthesis protein SbnA [Dictyobacter alpinus]
MDIQQLSRLSSHELCQLIHKIGHTPIQPLDCVVERHAHRIHLKLEGENPTGSMKDRTGYSLIMDIENRGLIQPGQTVIESTSGNLGVALAFLCKAKGYQFVAVIDPKTTQENSTKMQMLGATLEKVQTPDQNGGYLLTRLARVQQYCQQADYVWTNQYQNPANMRIHYMQTGPEIYEQMKGKVDVIFVPVSTGGSLAGIASFFREVSPSTKIIGVDAHGSVIFGTPAGTRKLTGIGSSQPSSFIHKGLYNDYIQVTDEEAFAMCRILQTYTNIIVGGSSGAVIAACMRYLTTVPDSGNIVCICADRGSNYESTIFNDEWIQEHHFHLPSDNFYHFSDTLSPPIITTRYDHRFMSEAQIS